MNETIKKTLSYLFAFMLIMTIVVLSIYFIQFHGKLSDNMSDWAAFGSFVGGTLGPLYAAGSLIWIVYTLFVQASEARKERRIDSLEKQVQFSREMMLKLMEKKFSSVSCFPLYERIQEIRNDINKVTIHLDDVHVYYKDGRAIAVEQSKDLFSLLIMTRNELGIVEAKKFICEENGISIKHHMETFVAQFGYYLMLLIKLNYEDYDGFAIRYMLSLFSNQLMILKDYGLVEEEVIGNYLVLHSQPFACTKDSVRKQELVDVLIDTFPDLKKCKISDFKFSQEINNSGNEMAHILTHIKTKEKYKWYMGEFENIK